MKILFLCKRRYMNKDVILERYARMYELPLQLANLGHEVRVECLSYHRLADGTWESPASPGSLRWRSTQIGRPPFMGLLRYFRGLVAASREFRPDVVFGGSDIPHCVFAATLARYLAKPYALDLYDNFESYTQARLPGAKIALRQAIRNADIVSCVSNVLTEYVRDSIGARGKLLTVLSTIDKVQFKPGDRMQARISLGLPADATLIGTAGTLFRDKGVGTLYDAFASMASRNPHLHLCLAGPVDPAMPVPDGARVHYLGQLPHSKIPTFFSALDVGIVCIRDTPFGRFCFPQKAYEMLASGTPIVASNVGAIGAVLRSIPQHLYRPDDAADLARALEHALGTRSIDVGPIPGWSDVVAPLAAALETL